MDLQITRFEVHKRVPLTISRGTEASSENVWVRLQHEGFEGWGEAAPMSSSDPPQDADLIIAALQEAAPVLAGLSPFQGQALESSMRALSMPSAAWAALDIARHDWLGKHLGMPLWQMWGLDLSRQPLTTVTIGIMSPAAAQERVRLWQAQTDARAWKIKLGNPEGIQADQAMLTAILDVLPQGATWMVDANGGWSLKDAFEMCDWLVTKGAMYVEQPLPRGQEEQLKELYQRASLPLFADESCRTGQDIPRLADRVDGINIKLLKCGGLSEAHRMIHTARACGLKVMFGCFSESALLNTAAAHLGPLADYLDLDSHLNLLDDPFVGATLTEGVLLPNHRPGLGVSRAEPDTNKAPLTPTPHRSTTPTKSAAL